MKFSNLRIGLRLGGSMAILLILMIAISIAGWVGVTKVDSVSDEQAHRLQRVALAREYAEMLDTHSEMMVAYMHIYEGAELERIKKKATEQTTRANAYLKTLEESAAGSDEGMALIAAIKDSIGTFRTARGEVQKLKDLNNPGDALDVQKLVDEKMNPAMQAYIAAVKKFGDWSSAQADEADARQTVVNATSKIVIAVCGLFALILGGIVGLLVTRSIVVPITQAVRVADTVAAGDLTAHIDTKALDETGQLLRALSAMTLRLRSVVGEVRSGVEAVNAAAGEIANGNADLSARTEQTAANLEQTAASLEEFTSTAQQAADTASQANQLANTAAQAAERGGEVVKQAVNSMGQITESSRKIADIINVIDGIAFQTNILALNAAVEAARAGEQGRGFAVVAGEVRALAQRSAAAAKEIKGLIDNSVHNVEAGSAQVAQAGQRMEEIVASVQRVSSLIGDITTSAAEQRDGINQVNQAVTNLDQMTQQNAALVEESTSAASSMRDQAQRLAEVVAVFNVGEDAHASIPTLTHYAAPHMTDTRAIKRLPR